MSHIVTSNLLLHASVAATDGLKTNMKTPNY